MNYVIKVEHVIKVEYVIKVKYVRLCCNYDVYVTTYASQTLVAGV